MTDAERTQIEKELKAFIDGDGRVTCLPAKFKKQLMAYYWIASQLKEDGVWNERELNAVLNGLHTFGDPAVIRRTLFDLGVLDRDPRGTRYTVITPFPTLDEFLNRGMQR